MEEIEFVSCFNDKQAGSLWRGDQQTLVERSFLPLLGWFSGLVFFEDRRETSRENDPISTDIHNVNIILVLQY